MEKQNKKMVRLLENLPECANKYINSLSLKASSKYTYACEVGNLYKYLSIICEKDASCIVPQDIERNFVVAEYRDYLETNGYSSPSINNKFRVARLYMDYLMGMELISQKPLFPSVSKIRNAVVYSESQYNELIEVADGISDNIKKTYISWNTERDILIYELIYKLGLKTSECSNIRMSDVMIKDCSIKVSRGKPIIMELNDKLQDMVLRQYMSQLEKGISSNSYLFTNNRQEKMSSRCIQSIIKKVVEDYDERLTPQLLRLLCGAKLYIRTGDLILVAQYMGISYSMAEDHYSAIKNKKNETVRVRVKVH